MLVSGSETDNPEKPLFICLLTLVMHKLSLSLCLSGSCALSSLVPAHPQKGLILHREGPLKIDKLAVPPALSPEDADVLTRADSILNAVVAAAFRLSDFKETGIG